MTDEQHESIRCDLNRIAKSLEELAETAEAALAILQGRPASADITLDSPQPTGESQMAKKALKSGPPVNMNDLQTDGATLAILDAQGKPVSPQPTDAIASAVWTSSDPTVLSVTPTPGNSFGATVATVGNPAKLGSATVSATVTYADGSVGPFTATSPVITVTSRTPASADITLGTPTP